MGALRHVHSSGYIKKKPGVRERRKIVFFRLLKESELKHFLNGERKLSF